VQTSPPTTMALDYSIAINYPNPCATFNKTDPGSLQVYVNI